MIKKLAICALAMLGLLAACEAERTQPQLLLDRAAAALENKDATKFMECLDVRAYAANQVKNLANNDNVLSSLDKLGNSLGIGGLNQIIGSLLDVTGNIRHEMSEGVATGQIMAQCRSATTPDCPWFPQSLKEARVVELGPDAAIAQVTTPANITSWLSLRKVGNTWQIVGRAPLEARARTYATESAAPQERQAPKNPPKPSNPVSI